MALALSHRHATVPPLLVTDHPTIDPVVGAIPQAVLAPLGPISDGSGCAPVAAVHRNAWLAPPPLGMLIAPMVVPSAEIPSPVLIPSPGRKPIPWSPPARVHRNACDPCAFGRVAVPAITDPSADTLVASVLRSNGAGSNP